MGRILWRGAGVVGPAVRAAPGQVLGHGLSLPELRALLGHVVWGRPPVPCDVGPDAVRLDAGGRGDFHHGVEPLWYEQGCLTCVVGRDEGGYGFGVVFEASAALAYGGGPLGVAAPSGVLSDVARGLAVVGGDLREGEAIAAGWWCSASCSIA